MAYLKNLRKSHAELDAFLREGDSHFTQDLTKDLHEELEFEPKTSSDTNDINEQVHDTEFQIPEENLNTDDLAFNEDNDYGFLPEYAFSDSEADSDEDEEDQISFSQEIATWVTECQLKREGINQLLQILRKQGHSLPKDSRTLLQTPKIVEAKNICGGQYKYYGIEIEVNKILEQHPKYVQNFNSVDLFVNVDGVPIFKSSGAQFWPILCRFGKFTPFLVALFYGPNKPTSVEEFLNDFLNELAHLQANGLTFNSYNLNVSLKGFICDAPARSLLKCIKGHTGYFSCERCTIKGFYKHNRVILYATDDYPSRNNNDFCQMNYTNHQMRESPLIAYDINCIEGFCLDYMHLVCLGVMKRILIYLKQGPKECKLSASQISLISDSLIQLNGKFPSEFARQPRSLYEVDRWKATEFRQFLLYSGPVVLKKALSKEAYEHFLVLTVAISMLLDADDEKRNSYVEYAKQLLHYFVHCSKVIYTEIFISYNVHNLLHLASDVNNFKCSLNDISAFPFENHLQSIKRLVRNAKNPLAQVTKRLHELEKFGNTQKIANTKNGIAFISTRPKDNCFMLRSDDYAFVLEKLADGKLLCKIVRQDDASSFFEKPCDSKLINIACVDKRTKFKRKILDKGDLYRKVACLPYNNCTNVLFPLLHGVEKRN